MSTSTDLFSVCRNYMDPAMAKHAGIYPYFQELGASDGPVVRVGGKEVVMLGSNNYLGLTHHPKVKQAAIEAIERYGTGCTGSRFLNGNLSLHAELERRIAATFGKEDAIVFTAGFLANAGVVSALGSIPGAVVFSERENHASLIEGTRLASGERHVFDDVEDLARQLAARDRWPHALVVTDAVFSMTGRVADLSKFVELKRRYGFKLYVDDAHGIGPLGPQGKGTVFAQGVEDEVDILFGTFSKSLASVGGFVAGEAAVMNWLRHKTRTLIFTAGLPPASAAAALAALEVMTTDTEMHARLWDNVHYWREGLHKLDFYTYGSTTPILPLFVGSESLAFRLCRDLLDLGVFATPVMYPAVPYGQAVIRTAVMPSHTRAHLDHALKALAQVRRRYPIPIVDGSHLPQADGPDWTYFFAGAPQAA